MPRPQCLVMCLILAIFASIRAIDAQTTTGSILGEVNDSSGGKLPGVTVTARNQENGASRETVTDALGTYSFSALPPGTYTVSAALAGFGPAERKDVKLPIASQVALPFVLQIASLAETVNVTEQAPLVDTTEHVVKTLIDSQKIESLPLKSRDFLDLTMLAPGVVSDQGSASAGQTDSISFGGMSENYKSVWLEGVDFNDEVTGGGSSLSSATRIALASEAIQEFQVMASSYSAEFGRSASGAINIVTKAGGNTVHGNGFYFRRADAFEAPNYFSETVQDRAVRRDGRRTDSARSAVLLRLMGAPEQQPVGTGQHPRFDPRLRVLARLRHAHRRAGPDRREQLLRQGDVFDVPAAHAERHLHV